jgi:glycosyltransferase involved in cell wall biosynthesis
LEVAGCGTIGRGDAMSPVSRVTYELSVELARLGHIVTVADAPAGDRPGWVEGMELAQFASPITPPKMGCSTAYSWIRETERFLSTCGATRLGDHDIIHSHDWLSAWMFAKLSRTPVVYTAHNANWVIDHARTPPPPLPGWRKLAGKRRVLEWDAIHSAAATVGLGKFMTQGLPDAPIKVIPSSIQPRWATMPTRAEARAKLGIDDAAFVILTVSRFAWEKGLDALIAAVALLGDKVDEAWIVGSTTNGLVPDDSPTPYARQLFDQAKGTRVRFIGLIPHSCEEFRLRTAAADIFVLPSIYECQGLAALEAMQAGLPVIATATGGLMDMVEGAGLVVPPRDPHALATAITKLRNDPVLRQQIGVKCRDRSAAYQWPDIARAHLSLFEGLVRGGADEAAARSPAPRAMAQ